MDTIGSRLRELRKEKGLTQQELADAIGLSKSAIVQYENNKRTPNYHAMYKLEGFFDASFQYLSGQTNNRLISTEHYLTTNENLKTYILDREGTKLSKYLVSFQNACSTLLLQCLEESDVAEDAQISQIKVLRDIQYILARFSSGWHYKHEILFRENPLSPEEFSTFMDNSFFVQMSQLQILLKQLYDGNKTQAYRKYLFLFDCASSEQVKLTKENIIDVGDEIATTDMNQFLRCGIPD